MSVMLNRALAFVLFAAVVIVVYDWFAGLDKPPASLPVPIFEKEKAKDKATDTEKVPMPNWKPTNSKR